MKAYPPSVFIKDSFHKAFTGVRENPEEELLKDQWIAIVKHKAVFDLLLSSALSAFFIGSVLTILFKKDIARKDEKFLRGASLVSPQRINSAVKKYQDYIREGKSQIPEKL